jgi:hypothetical protein
LVENPQIKHEQEVGDEVYYAPGGLPDKGNKRSAIENLASPLPLKKAREDSIAVIEESDKDGAAPVGPLLVLSHTLVIRPDSLGPGAGTNKELRSFLSSFKETDEPILLCDYIEFAQRRKQNATFVCLPPSEKYRASDVLFQLPRLAAGLPVGGAHSVRPQEIGVQLVHRIECGDWLNAAVFLSETEDSVQVNGVLYVQKGVAPEDEVAPGTTSALPFHFRLLVSVSLKPAFFRVVDPLSDSRRLLLYNIFPPHETNTSVVARVKSDTGGTEYNGDTSVGFFYECLRPAPRDEIDASALLRQGGLKGKGKAREENEMDWEEAEGQKDLPIVRPPGLVPQLLPFQSRTVRWLLCREGQKVVPGYGEEDGVAPLDRDALKELARGPLWEKVTSVQGEALWVNRVGAAISWEDPAEKTLREADAEERAFEIGGEGVRHLGLVFCHMIFV